jgi:hypothetical protein
LAGKNQSGYVFDGRVVAEKRGNTPTVQLVFRYEEAHENCSDGTDCEADERQIGLDLHNKIRENQ